MVLNCTNLTYATGAGLRAFLNIARMMQAVGGTLSVQGLKGQPREIFHACGMDRMIPVNEVAAISVAHQVA